mmetsp:Transcript_14764/g.32098  ORF Transcript_14764/g.32098 Transcript_14764/m.32098 type:complete len:141 (-) Transcript_14764:158-580(-)
MPKASTAAIKATPFVSIVDVRSAMAAAVAIPRSTTNVGTDPRILLLPFPVVALFLVLRVVVDDVVDVAADNTLILLLLLQAPIPPTISKIRTIIIIILCYGAAALKLLNEEYVPRHAQNSKAAQDAIAVKVVARATERVP